MQTIKSFKLLLILLSISVLLFSCNSASYVRFSLKEKYYLSENERELTRDTMLLNSYDKFNNDLENQVPLEKIIAGKNYLVYLGTAINNQPETMYEVYKKDTSHTIFDNRTTIYKNFTTYEFFTKKTGDYNYKIIFKNKSPYTSVINIVSTDSIIIKNFYNNKYIAKKLIKK